MPSMFSDPLLEQKRTASETATGAYNTSVAEGASLPDMLKESLMKKFSTNNPLIQQREGQLTNYLNTTTQAPLDYTARSAGGTSDIIYNPLQQANLIQSRRSSALAPLATTNDLIDLQTGGIQNLIDASTRAYAGETARLKGGAELSRQSYQDYLNELSMKADEAYKNASLASKDSGLDSVLTNLLLSYLTGNQNEPQPVEGKIPLDDLIEADQNDIQTLLGGGIKPNIPINTSSATLAPPKKKKKEETIALSGVPAKTLFPNLNLSL